MSLERDANAIDQCRSREGFGQEANRARLQGPGTNGLIGEGGNEYERHAVTLGAAYSTDLGGSVSASWSDRNLFGNAEVLTLGVAEIGRAHV